jgi:cell division protein FtsQ
MARRRRRGVLVRPRERGAVRRRALRLLNASLMGAAILAVAAGMHALRDPQRFPLRRVQVAGAIEHVDRATLTAAIAPLAAAGFFRVDVAGVRAAARAVPWVDTVEVRRVWPDRLVVEIAEQEPAARWAAGGLVNVRGERFEVPGDPSQDLPLLAGPAQESARVLARYREFAQVLDPVGRLQAAALDARGTWRLTLEGGIEITVRAAEADARLARFARIYTTRMAGRVPPLASVDLRYADGFAVRHRQASATSPSASVARL